MNKPALLYYEFGPFRLSPADRLLMRDEQVVSLTPKVIDMLIVLVENSGHVLTRDVLMSTLWPDSFVEESSLTQNISVLRKTLADEGNLQHCIETIPKRGYRFVADVRAVTVLNGADGELVLQERTSTEVVIEEHLLDDAEQRFVAASNLGVNDAAPVRIRSRKVYVTLVSVAALTITFTAYWFHLKQAGEASLPMNSIAVLPFKTLDLSSQTDPMGLGMADAVILKLTHLDRITVLPTSSILKYANRDSDARSIGRDLGVDAILDGTIQRDGDRVRVTAVLIRVYDGKTIWSRKLEDRYTNIFALQDAISGQLVRTLAPGIEGRAAENPPSRLTENPEAYEAYLMGFYFWSQRNQENLQKAITYLEQAVKKDDKFAKAHAVLADAYYLSFQQGYGQLSQSEALSKASASVERALALDDAVAEAHLVKAGIAFAENRHDEADKEFNRALELNPSYAPAHLRYGYFLFFESKLDQSLSEMKRAAQLDPVSPTSHLGLAYVRVMARDFDGAIAENRKAIELQPNHTVARLNLAEAYILKQMFREAEAELDKLENSDSSVGRDRAYLYAMSGRVNEALRILAELKTSKNYSAISPYDYAVVYAALGDKNSAFDSLQKTNPTRGALAKLRFDPQLDVLRSDKRFAEIMQRPTLEIRATK